ncbi:MAG: diguanylate cyclase [Pseudomonadales bacterium]|nr:diguanylate cyclase [Pseudomonadales bacterium]
MIQVAITDEVLRKWQSIVNMVASTFCMPAGFIVRHLSEGYEVLIASTNQENPYQAGSIIPHDTNIFCRQVVLENKMLSVTNARNIPEWTTNPEVCDDGFNTYVGFPIHNPDGSIFGTICVMDFKAEPVAQNYIDLLEQFRSVAELDLVTLQQLQDVTDLSLKDDLTGLYNRRGFNILAQNHIGSRRVDCCKMALVIVDINLLKQINDQHGHTAGDRAIVLTGEALKNACRNTDIVARVGGDEFFLGLYINEDDEIEQVLLRAKAYLEQHTPDFCQVSFSSGYCIKDVENGTRLNLLELVDEADRSLYQQKTNRLRQTDQIPHQPL